MNSENLSVETCLRLKAAGYPQRTHDNMYFYWGEEEGWSFGAHPDEAHRALDRVACPPVISADGKSGVLPWFERKKVSWIHWPTARPSWEATFPDRDPPPYYPDYKVEAETPELFINAIMDSLERAEKKRMGEI